MPSSWFKQTFNPELQQILQHVQSVATHPNVCSLIRDPTPFIVSNRIQPGVTCFHSVLKHEAFQALCCAVECLGPPLPQIPTTYSKDSKNFRLHLSRSNLLSNPTMSYVIGTNVNPIPMNLRNRDYHREICMEHMRNLCDQRTVMCTATTTMWSEIKKHTHSFCT